MTATGRGLLARAARLAEAGEPFVLATVVRRTPPTSARAGNRALVDGDGTLHGWLGGSCIEPVVRHEAAGALRDGEPRLLVFSPDPGDDRPGVRHHPMTCHSGGTVEVYLEPELPPPRLTLYGDSPVTRALAIMARPLGWRVRAVGVDEGPAFEGAVVVARDAAEPSPGVRGTAGDGEVDGAAADGEPGAEPADGASRDWAVVATMGEWDEEAVERALASGAAYVGMVGSPRRAAEVRRTLGLAEDDDRLTSPAGLDVGARAPAEIAVTILAEILQRRQVPRGADGRTAGGGRPEAGEAAGADGVADGVAVEAPGGTAVDPVCHMEVAPVEAAATAEHDGVAYHFCSDGCRRRFEREPARFL